MHSDNSPPPPSFEIQFFPPTNKFAAGRQRGGGIFFEFIAQKDAFLRPFSPFYIFSLTLNFFSPADLIRVFCIIFITDGLCTDLQFHGTDFSSGMRVN